jgi:hypothetical protein
LEAAILSRTRSPIRFRSNWATDALIGDDIALGLAHTFELAHCAAGSDARLRSLTVPPLCQSIVRLSDSACNDANSKMRMQFANYCRCND